MTFWDLTFDPYLQGTHGDEDGALAKAFLDDLEAHFAARGVPRSVPLAMRLEEVLSATLKLRALEQAVQAQGVTVPEKSKPSDPDPAASSSRLLEPLAKLHERRRKALAELEALYARTGAPSPTPKGLPDLVKPLLKQAEGVLEESLGPDDDSDGEPSDEDG